MIGNLSVLNKSLARFTNGTATAGAYAANTRANFQNPAVNKSRIIYWSGSQAEPDGYNIGEAIYPALKGKALSSFTPILGEGSVSGVLWEVKLSEAALSGSASVAGDLAVLSPAEAALSGSATLSADLIAVAGLLATLAGTGSVTADIGAVVPMEGALSGQGSASVNLTGTARLEAEITPFTDLSPEGLAGSLLDSSEIESGYSLREALRLILSSVAGKLSGGGTSTITIRSITDGTNRIVATVDANGNRSSVTYDVGDE